MRKFLFLLSHVLLWSQPLYSQNALPNKEVYATPFRNHQITSEWQSDNLLLVKSDLTICKTPGEQKEYIHSQKSPDALAFSEAFLYAKQAMNYPFTTSAKKNVINVSERCDLYQFEHLFHTSTWDKNIEITKSIEISYRENDTQGTVYYKTCESNADKRYGQTLAVAGLRFIRSIINLRRELSPEVFERRFSLGNPVAGTPEMLHAIDIVEREEDGCYQQAVSVAVARNIDKPNRVSTKEILKNIEDVSYEKTLIESVNSAQEKVRVSVEASFEGRIENPECIHFELKDSLNNKFSLSLKDLYQEDYAILTTPISVKMNKVCSPNSLDRFNKVTLEFTVDSNLLETSHKGSFKQTTDKNFVIESQLTYCHPDLLSLDIDAINSNGVFNPTLPITGWFIGNAASNFGSPEDMIGLINSIQIYGKLPKILSVKNTNYMRNLYRIGISYSIDPIGCLTSRLDAEIDLNPSNIRNDITARISFGWDGPENIKATRTGFDSCDDKEVALAHLIRGTLNPIQDVGILNWKQRGGTFFTNISMKHLDNGCYSVTYQGVAGGYISAGSSQLNAYYYLLDFQNSN